MSDDEIELRAMYLRQGVKLKEQQETIELLEKHSNMKEEGLAKYEETIDKLKEEVVALNKGARTSSSAMDILMTENKALKDA